MFKWLTEYYISLLLPCADCWYELYFPAYFLSVHLSPVVFLCPKKCYFTNNWLPTYINIRKFSVQFTVAWLRWSRGSMLAFSTQVRGFKPGWSRQIFKGEKILSTPSFRGEGKPSVPCRRYAACKRFLMAWIETPCRQNYQTPFLAHSSTFCC